MEKGSVAKILKPIKNNRRIAATEAFSRKKGAAFALFVLTRFSSAHYFDELKNFATLPNSWCNVRETTSP